MTYINKPFSYPLDIVAFPNCTSALISADSVVKPQTTDSLAGSPQSTINVSDGIITIPNTQCLLIGSIMYKNFDNASYARFRWYDVTNSQYIGAIGQIRGLDPERSSGISGAISCDEEALAIAQNIQVKLVITAVSSNDLYIDGSHAHGVYVGKTRLLVYEF